MKRRRRINKKWATTRKIIPFVFFNLMLFSTAHSQSKIGTTGNAIQNGQLVIEYSLGEPAIATISNSNQAITQGLIQPDPVIDCSNLLLATTPDSFFYTRGLSSISINPLLNDILPTTVNSKIIESLEVGNLSVGMPGDVWTLSIPESYTGSTILAKYEVCSEICNLVCDTSEIKIRISGNIPKAISPNGDGKNDDFDPVKIIEESGFDVNLKNTQLVIYERSGEAIASLSPYILGGWRGTQIPSSMPIGTYYYILDVVFKDDTKSQVRGALQLIR